MSNPIIKMRGVLFALPLLAFGGATQAAIEGAQTSFYYNAYGGFQLNSHSASVPSVVHYIDENDWYKNNAPLPETNNFMEIAWGSGDSNLQLLEVRSAPAIPPRSVWTQEILLNDGEHINGSVKVGDPFGSLFGYITHFNNVISTAFLGTVDIHWHLDLYADAAKTMPVWYSPEMNFQLEILETENFQDTCPGGFSAPCPDRLRYRILPGGELGNTLNLPMGTFVYNQIPYSINASGFYNEQGAVGGTFWSLEGEHNHAFVNFSVQAVPEPSDFLAMLAGIPLVAYAVKRRRSRSAAA